MAQRGTRADSNGQAAAAVQREELLLDEYLSRFDDDLGERDRLEAERDFWRHLFSQLVHAHPERAFVTAADGTITNWNPEIDTEERPAEAVVGSDAYETLNPDGEDETLAESVAAGNEAVREEDTRTTPATDEHYQVFAVPLRDPDGSAVGAYEVILEVTDYVEQRAELETLQRSVSEEIRSTVVDLEETAETVVTSTEGVQDLGEEQTDRMETIAAEVSNQSATIEEIASTAEEVERTSDRAAGLADDGADAADSAIETMRSVSDAADTVSADIGALRDGVDEIDEVVDVINDIAEQTNILALNASIEAARAGEAGSGFAVVADEVKSLAEDSQQQAGRIESMVDDIKTDIEGTAASLETTTDRLDEGVDQVGTAMDRLDAIVDAAEEAAQGVGEVSDAIDDQAASSEEIASIIEDAVTEMTELQAELASIADATRDQHESVADVHATVRRLADTE